MTFRVYHDAAFPTTLFGDPPERRFPDDYEEVASVECESVEAAFGLTNHVTGRWWDNPLVTKTTEKSHRSTSAGDVVVCPDGAVRRFLNAGHEEVGRTGVFTLKTYAPYGPRS